jgi:two-component system, cell cycle sensor histidine kinase and response regulator CckA
MKSDAVFVLGNASWPVLLVDKAGGILRANSAAFQAFAPTLKEGGRLADIWSSENLIAPETFLAQTAPGSPSSVKVKASSGETLTHMVWVCSSPAGEAAGFVLQFFAPGGVGKPKAPGEDIAVIQSQKLECALQMARTVALDFNNALTVILGHTSLVLSKMEPEHPWRRSLLEVEKSAAHAAEIAGDLGAFSRAEKEARPPVSGNVNSQVQRCVEYFQHNPASEPIEWAVQLERKLFAAKFDEAKLQQALLRILENSVQSLGQQRRISVQTRNLELAEPTQDRNVQLAAGSFVCVEVTDTGCGMDAAILPRVFEPFFTTKRPPHRGLGLAWVYGIVTNHGGGVAISSQPGTGTSVRVYLPAEKRTVRDTQMPGGDLKGNGQTILMVDDEDLLLVMGETILSSHGYKVLTANSGPKALEVLSTEGVSVDLVVTDLVMPAMSGRELIERMHQLAPGTKVLCTSGYTWSAGQIGRSLYLQKPFTSNDLLAKVKQALGGRQEQ